ncbi:MAG TPA: hypothetical protein VHL59_09865 [Thermoanaerobaculia bacterium]|nr:hypothetical protein [Thermoanaerobaculia bacterium]
MKTRKTISTIVAAALAATILGCSNELADGAPVELVVTNTQTLQRIDLNGGEGCDENIGTINMEVIPKNAEADGSFNQVRVNRYRVSYQRTDGGTLVPRPFVRSIDTLIAVGGSAGLEEIVLFEQDVLFNAPFPALLPNNGGRDPEKGRPVVEMDVIVEVFGQTLGGDRVFDATRFQLDFCFLCDGCD